MAAAGDPHDGLGRAHGVGHGLGGQNHDGAVDILVFDDGGQGVFIAILGRVADHVHRVVHVGRGRQVGLQRFDGVFTELGQGEA